MASTGFPKLRAIYISKTDSKDGDIVFEMTAATMAAWMKKNPGKTKFEYVWCPFHNLCLCFENTDDEHAWNAKCDIIKTMGEGNDLVCSSNITIPPKAKGLLNFAHIHAYGMKDSTYRGDGSLQFLLQLTNCDDKTQKILVNNLPGIDIFGGPNMVKYGQ